MDKYKIKKIEDQARNEADENKVEELNLEKNKLRKAKRDPHVLFMKFFNAFLAKETDQVNDLLDLVEAYYKPRLA